MTGIIAYQLMAPPLIGIADNGDFPRFLDRVGLKQIPTDYDDNYFSYFNSRYRVVPPARSGAAYMSSTEIFIRAARWINVHFIDETFFDVRVLGSLYIAFYLMGVALILYSSRSLRMRVRLVLAGLLILFLTDIGYTAYFNSFYSEPTVLCFFVIAVGSATTVISGTWRSLAALSIYFLACGILVISKPMYIPFAVVFAIFGVYLSSFAGSRWRYWLSGTLAALICVTALWYRNQTPEWLTLDTNYHGLFCDLLTHSPTPEQDFSELGLDPAWKPLIGKSAYVPDSPLSNPDFKNEFRERVGSFTTPLFYLARPSRFFGLARRSAKHVFQTRVDMGYYEKQTGRPPRTKPPALWSHIRDLVFPKSVWFLLAFFSTALVATAIVFAKALSDTIKGLAALSGLLIVLALGVFLIPILLIGELDLVRYLILFNVAFEMLLILLAVSLTNNKSALIRIIRGRWFREG